MPRTKFVPPPPGIPFSPPEPVYGRTGGSFVLNRKTEKPKQEKDDEAEQALPVVALHHRFLGRYR
jgi:hypothetical protein